MRQIDDPIRLRRRAANLERALAAAPARESTPAFLRGILEEVRFVVDSPLEQAGFEPSVPLLGVIISRLPLAAPVTPFPLVKTEITVSLTGTES
jgi:hypothetical protein